MNPETSGSPDKVLFECSDSVGVITLNRPDAGNALDAEMVRCLAAIFERVVQSPEVRVVVLEARGRAFCVGGDINAFQENRGNLPEFVDSLLEPLHRAIAKLGKAGRPIISVLNGAVGGGGIGIALSADFVLASDSMKLRSGYTALGLTPDAGSSWFLTRRAGAIRATQVFLLNDALPATTCLEWGVVDAIYPASEIRERALDLARRLSVTSGRAVSRVKVLVDAATRQGLSAQLGLERELMVASASEPDVHEGIGAFLEKRSPRFQ